MIMCVILEKVQINTHTQTLRKQQHCVLYIYMQKLAQVWIKNNFL